MKHFIYIICLFFILGLGSFYTDLERAFDLPQSLFLFITAVSLILLQQINKFNFYQVLGLVAVAIGGSFLPAISARWAMISIGICLFFLFQDLDQKAKEKLKLSVIALGSIQAIFCLLSFANVEGLVFYRHNGAPIGSIGNSDFLATLLCASIFFWKDIKVSRSFKWILYVLLFAALISTRSRGSILIACLLLINRKHLKLILAPGAVAAIIASFFLWPKFGGRIQLWLVSLKAFTEKPLSGFGLDNFNSVYFNTNLKLMSDNPQFRAEFGPWSSMVMDAHNLFLQWGVELGILGVILAGLFLFFVFNRARDADSNGNQNLLIMLLLKSLYTVVLTSTQALGLGALALTGKSKTRSPKYQFVLFVVVGILLSLSAKSIYTDLLMSKNLHDSKKFLQLNLSSMALENLSKVEKLRPKDSDTLLMKSFALMKQHRCIESRDLALKASQLYQNMDVYKRAGHILYDCAFYDEALSLFAPLHKVFPEHRTTIMKISWIKYHQGKWRAARKYATLTKNLKPRRKSYSDERNLREADEILSLTTAY